MIACKPIAINWSTRRDEGATLLNASLNYLANKNIKRSSGIQKLCHRLADRQISLSRQWISQFSWALTSRTSISAQLHIKDHFLAFFPVSLHHSARIIWAKNFFRVCIIFWFQLIAMHENEQIAYILHSRNFEQWRQQQSRRSQASFVGHFRLSCS